jgi:hypothetical protein
VKFLNQVFPIRRLPAPCVCDLPDDGGMLLQQGGKFEFEFISGIHDQSVRILLGALYALTTFYDSLQPAAESQRSLVI